MPDFSPAIVAERTVKTIRHCIIVANPRAGAGDVIGATRAVLASPAVKTIAVLELSRDPALAARLNELCASSDMEPPDPPVIACVGGDGTISAVLNLLERPDRCALAVIPTGSGNDVARELGIRSLGAALEGLRDGIARSIDFGIVNGQRFINCVGMGLDAEVARMAANIRARGVFHAVSYYLAALRGLLTVRPVAARIASADSNEAAFDDLVMLTIGNGCWYGGGFRGAPLAELDDGLLDCYAYRDVPGFFRRLALMQRIKAGAQHAEPNVTHFKTARLTAEFSRAIAMHVDGEISATARVEISLVPRGVRVLTAREP